MCGRRGSIRDPAKEPVVAYPYRVVVTEDQRAELRGLVGAEKIEYRADAAICNACSAKARCTPSDRGRQVHRSFYADHLDHVRGYHGTAAYQKAMRTRQVWLEPLFAEAKQWHGLERFRLRGLAKVNMAGLLVAAGQHLKRWLRATEWGRRPWPGASAMPLPVRL